MRKLLTLLIISCSSLYGFSQTVLWTEAFQNGCANDCLATGYVGPNGAWTQTLTGLNGADANVFYVSGQECGNGSGVCGSVCGAADPSLHIGSNASVFGDQGASFLNGGFGFFFPETDVRVESPTINMTGNSNLTLTFNYIENGDGANDNASVWYFNGATWALLQDMAKTPLTCNPQGTWTALSIALPASANNNPSIKIGFRWVNNDDGVGTDPSFAVDDIQITTPSAASPPVADFTASTTSLCAGDCITFTNTSTFVAGATFSWNFGNTQTSALQTPGSICYATAGNYTVTLTVTDANGTDTETKTNYIVVNAPVSAGLDNTTNLCNNNSLNLTTLLSGAGSGGTWLETTAVPSGQFNTGTAVFDANGLAAGNYTFSYTLAGTAPCPNDVANFTVTVSACSGPTAVINASSLTVCAGQSLIFNSASTGTNISAYVWSFGSGLPGTANTAGPHSVQFNTVGTFNVWLQVTDDNGTDDQTIQITVTSCSSPTASFGISDDVICPGDCIVYNNTSTSVGATTYTWTFTGGTPATYTGANPGPVCYAVSGNYGVSLNVTNAFGSNNYSQTIDVVTLPTIVATGDTIIDMGGTANIAAVASEGEITWAWTPNNQGNILDCTAFDCTTADVNPVITTVFTATTTTTEGCQVTDNVIVTVDYQAAIGVPNSFSPNGDGQNDVLFVKGLGITNMIFRIYNRYGNLVFESTNQADGWDGRFNQQDESSATFVYTLEYTLVNGQIGNLNGNITLVR
jgi:gliding motility-associated-like protein